MILVHLFLVRVQVPQQEKTPGETGVFAFRSILGWKAAMKNQPPQRHTSVLLGLTAVVVAVALTACTPSPKTTYVDAGGQSVTLDWADYPGQAGVDAGEVVLAPSAEEVRARSALILGEIEQRVSSEFGLNWENGTTGTEERDEPRYGGSIYPNGGNGYGGESLYVTYNSISRETLSIPQSVDDWNRIQDIINDVARAHGLGEFASDGLVEHWRWSGTAYGESQWLYG
jgi:hypothetical protein